jgi:hypothetical protein
MWLCFETVETNVINFQALDFSFNISFEFTSVVADFSNNSLFHSNQMYYVLFIIMFIIFCPKFP